jgi:uncharacterized membrane protein
MVRRQWLLKRNCSLGPGRTAIAYAAPCLLLLPATLAFAIQGAWIMLVFGLAQCAAMVLAFLCYARRASDHECISLSEELLVVETVEAGKARRHCFQPYWTSMVMPGLDGRCFYLQSKGIRLRVGSFACPELMQEVAFSLCQALRDLRIATIAAPITP